jgi:hypothetical protein
MDNYYDVGGISVIDFIKAKLTPEEYKGFLTGNVIKYLARCEYKTANPRDDIKKAKQYMDWLEKSFGEKKKKPMKEDSVSAFGYVLAIAEYLDSALEKDVYDYEAILMSVRKLIDDYFSNKNETIT